jgi:hypothetical protein
MKRCTGCGEVKPLAEFNRNARGTGGREAKCKVCTRRRNRKLLEDPTVRVRALAMHARVRAKERGLDFDEDLSDLLPPPTRCPVLGIPIDYGMGKKKPPPNGPSIDRIDPARGYVKGNRVVISWRANRLKSDATSDELAALAMFYNARGGAL